ncbi:carboxypeptidase-like regulatory domain-containing protein [Hymenobacter sediminicola]|uniref:Carboxypeptidase-like regulatory domain-containing protein n=1 Tax=Hymenobacter sediminicola TaxID=2761579 RepID=A0A7G7W720_9BACT|nr:carboxypeptidase-like regulatory domain-containing protein [Hymenobacter sediminicola]QNH62163.1 carboxypeptidase-like regulatory domain-containing protein [Hymenobacter sediminicola]
MPRPVSLAVPQPCHESWAQMTPAAQGRHCAACDKVVLDFTQKTDAEILALLQHAAAPCGRFRPDQLGRTLHPYSAVAPRWRTWLAAAAMVLGLREIAAEESRGQQPVSIYLPKLISHDEQKAALLHQRRVADEPADTVVVRGRVVDKATGEVLPGVTVLLKGTSTGISTVADGTFELAVPSSLASTLSISSIGYITDEIPIATVIQASGQLLTIRLATDIMGQITGFGYRPWYTPAGLWLRISHPFRYAFQR